LNRPVDATRGGLGGLLGNQGDDQKVLKEELALDQVAVCLQKFKPLLEASRFHQMPVKLLLLQLGILGLLLGFLRFLSR
jgi:hypothetical protein